MSVRARPHPTIPDHEVLRKIGGGAYGEVWLARGVTGALRAVKVVWREDFEDERGFEREFEGILKFEPISRDHPALVNILHVGRSPDGVSFYYYVMELGDDITTGREINPVEYQPRTLRGDHPQAAGVRWEINECIDVGIRLAEALGHLHDHGLAHRDVKPSNIIFVNGRAKLADIGLVAARGQRTFVGTEGFVPPEGPGSTQADIYSLGKVLYEMATGKDRMDFPELPDEMPAGTGRRRWLELNRVICDICEPRISKRQITTAAELADSLRRIQSGKSGQRSMASVWLATFLLIGFTIWAGWEISKDRGWLNNWVQERTSPEPASALLRVFSTPEGADVIDANGVVIGTTPTPTIAANVGEEVAFTLRKRGYLPLEIRGTLTLAAVTEPMVLSGQLRFFSPPQIGEVWTDHLGTRYQPLNDHHVSSGFVTARDWKQFAKAAGEIAQASEIISFSQDGEAVEIVLASPNATAAFCQWLRDGGIGEGYLTAKHEVRALPEASFENPTMSERARSEDLRPFRVMIRKFSLGRLRLSSQPPGAEVYLDGHLVGTTEHMLEISGLKPGNFDLLLVLEGYKPLEKTITLAEGQNLGESIILEQNEGVVFGRPWENGIKMRFMPVGRELMASIWETRVSDYALFVTETGHPNPPAAPFTQEPDHPVINVSRDDARAFCQWLTRRERKDERITRSHEYRLPTDLEWSLMAGLIEEEGISPGWRFARKQAVFPWGTSWPNSEKVGNFADVAAARSPGVTAGRTIAGYDDGFAYTAPVGSFPPNELGLFDLGGNAQEWVEDEYSKLGTNVLGVLRGGGWNTYQIEQLYIGARNAVPPDYRDAFYGFRVVLAKIPPQPE
jgi:eukaryotic-like serine/threonine-protein kinase